MILLCTTVTEMQKVKFGDNKFVISAIMTYLYDQTSIKYKSSYQ